MPPLQIESNGHTTLMNIACGKFRCRVCGPRLRLKFMAQVVQGMDVDCSFLTLTTRLRMSLEDLNKAWAKWLKRVQRRLKKLEWVKVVEYQKNGNPHIHAIIKKDVRSFGCKRYKEWNNFKKKNDWWVDKDDWLVKAWQEVCNDPRITRVALNPVLVGGQDKKSASAELSKYLSKEKSKGGDRSRWFSFSKDFRGCRPELKTVGTSLVPSRKYIWFTRREWYKDNSKWSWCTHEELKHCACSELVICWNFKYYDHVFINFELVRSMVNGVLQSVRSSGDMAGLQEA